MHGIVEQAREIIKTTNRNRKLGFTRFECEVAALGLLTDKEGLNELCLLHAQVNTQFTEMNASTKVGSLIPEQVVYPNIMKTIHDIGLRVVRIECNPKTEYFEGLLNGKARLLLMQLKRDTDGAENAHFVAIRFIDDLPRETRRRARNSSYNYLFADTENPIIVGMSRRGNLVKYVEEKSSQKRTGLFVVELAKRNHH